MDFAALQAPFPPDRVSWRIGSTTQDKNKGMALAYIDARDVYERLDAVCGPGGWQCRYSHADKKTICEVGIKVGGEWVWKANGAGDSDVEAEKGALSDAVKRAAVVWGIGRYLYDIDSPWVEIETKGKSHVIKPSERGKLLAALGQRSAPSRRPEPALAPQTASTVKVADNGADAKADGLIAQINGMTSGADLDEFKADPDFLTLYKRLSLSNQARVQAAGKRKAESFAAPIGAG